MWWIFISWLSHPHVFVVASVYLGTFREGWADNWLHALIGCSTSSSLLSLYIFRRFLSSFIFTLRHLVCLLCEKAPIFLLES